MSQWDGMSKKLKAAKSCTMSTKVRCIGRDDAGGSEWFSETDTTMDQ